MFVDYFSGAFTHMLRWARMGCSGNSVYFSGGVHTLSYQCIPPHPIPASVVSNNYLSPIPFHPSVCVNAPLLLCICAGGQYKEPTSLWRALLPCLNVSVALRSGMQAVKLLQQNTPILDRVC